MGPNLNVYRLGGGGTDTFNMTWYGNKMAGGVSDPLYFLHDMAKNGVECH